ncbi:MAG TPA: hypothetical protein VF546_02155 [Pyrinomonadaceae bacterium]|jgi:hypothetical protein
MKAIPRKWREKLVAGLRRRVAAREQLEELRYSIQHMLPLPLQEADALARAGAAQHARLEQLVSAGEPDRALAAFRRLPLPLALAQVGQALEPHAGASYLLALPLTTASVALLAHLVADARRQFRIVDTPYTRFFFHPFLTGEPRARVRLLSSAQMLAHHREQAAAPAAAPVTYVTFPDHQTSRSETMWRVPFLGEDYEFSTLEPLLYYRGLRPLFTFDASEFAATGRFTLQARNEAAAARPVAEADVRALLVWLAAQVEAVFRARPADVLAWSETQMRAARMKARVAVVKLKLTEGYVRAWHAADPTFKAETYARSIAELRKLQEAANAPEKARAAAR